MVKYPFTESEFITANLTLQDYIISSNVGLHTIGFRYLSGTSLLFININQSYCVLHYINTGL